MNLTLRRTSFTAIGVFGILLDEASNIICYTLEHAYPSDTGTGWDAKVPVGQYTCVRGQHALSNGVPFTTFEITGVPGHQGILFHCGNSEQDSHGCVLVGSGIEGTTLTASRVAFTKLMDLLSARDKFQIVVKD